MALSVAVTTGFYCRVGRGPYFGRSAAHAAAEIVPYIEFKMETNIKDSLLRHGFSFDIALQQNGSVQLIEIN
jgi:hypothetical protein